MPDLKTIFLLLILVRPAFSQEEILGINFDHLRSVLKIAEVKLDWKFRHGDNPAWSADSLDDSDWQTVDNSLLNRGTPQWEDWTGIGWYRLNFEVDSAYVGQRLAFVYQQSCAVEIFINGEFTDSYGTVSGDKNEESCFATWNQPRWVPYTFDKPGRHTLAVRYSYHPNFLNPREEWPSGFSTTFMKQSRFRTALIDHVKVQSAIRFFFTGVPLAFTVLHLFLFLFNRRYTTNLFYSFFTFSCALLTFFILGASNNKTQMMSDTYLIVFKMSLVFIFMSSFRFLYALFYKKLQRQIYLFGPVAITLLLFSWYVNILEIYIFGFICLAEQVRIVIVANGKKKPGARLIGLGYILFGIGCTIQMLMGFGVIPETRGFHQYPYLEGILGILVCMSIYLAREFTHTQKSLEKVSEAQKDTIRDLKYEMLERKKAEELNQKQQQELIQADKMATLGILVSGVAHEINNPNNYMLLNSNNLADIWKDLTPHLDKYAAEKGDFKLGGMAYSDVKDEVPPLISSIAEGSERIRKIVDNLKDFARKDPGATNQSVNMYSVIEASTSILSNLIKKSTHHFNVNCPPDLPTVKGNFQQLEQVIINLISNACQALENQEQKLSITVVHEQNRLITTVEDTGKGIEKEDLAHILDPFFTTKRDSGGTGLGLSITYTIVKDHKGDLVYESEVGQGTKAVLSLPLKKGEIH